MQNREIKLEKKHVFYSEHSLQVGDYVTARHCYKPVRVIYIDYVEDLVYILKSGPVPDHLVGKKPYRSTSWPDFDFAEIKSEYLIYVHSKEVDYLKYRSEPNYIPVLSEEDAKTLNELIEEL